MYSTPPIVDLIKGECDNYKPQAKTHVEVNGLFMNLSYNLHVARSTMRFVDSRYRVTYANQDTESCAPEEPCRFRVLISFRIRSQTAKRVAENGRDTSDTTCEVMTQEVVIRPAETTS